mmetsp:Transcript_91835/g.163450  ORF Transcript_91835/g.163450 Transcript_91835/m.163450 type:complete len:224 (-) Transcript_91835:93-764(-)
MSPAPDELLTAVSHVTKAPKWSFPGRTQYPNKVFGIGPYCADDPHRDINGRFKRDPSWTMQVSKGRGARPSSAPPGPGRYRPTESSKANAPSWGFGSTPREGGWLAKGSAGPGPAAYKPDFGVNYKRGPAYSSAGKPKQPSNSLGPGPAHYKPPRSTLKSNTSKWGVPGRNRPQSAHATVGGPGPNYFIESHANGPKYTMGARREAADREPRKLYGPRTQFGY